MHIEMDPNIRPVHAPRRRIPVARVQRVNEALERLCEDSIISPVTQPTDWLSNMLIKEKPNGKLRICIDPSQTINRALINHENPLLAKFGRQKVLFLGVRAPRKAGETRSG